jgi:hypothetical protein
MCSALPIVLKDSGLFLSCEVRFVLNTLESILLEGEYLDHREVIT